MRMLVGRFGEGWLCSMLTEESNVAVDTVSLWRDVFVCDLSMINCSISISVSIMLTRV
jgi:hypothetical protein